MENCQEYVLYKGEEILIIGDICAIAHYLNTTPKQAYWYATPSNLKRNKGNRKILVKLDDEEGV